MKTRRIGIDFHGVINDNPEFFCKFTSIAVTKGFEVHVISGGPHNLVKKYLEDNHIYYTKLWCIFDFFHHKNKVTFNADGSFSVDDELWNRAKARYCEENDILLHIDDSPIYGRYFTSPYCYYDTQSKTCRINGKTVSLQDSPDDLFSELINM